MTSSPSAVRRPAVLVAEGDPAARHAALALLHQLGLDAEAVGDGESAVRRAAGGAYDSVLMRLRLPGMGGVEAMKAVRGVLPPARQPRVVAVVSQESGRTHEQLLAAGFDAVCPAPLEAEALAAALGLAAPVPAEAPASGSEPPALEVQVRAHIAALIGEDDPEFAADLIATFAETSRETLDEVRAALAGRDARALGSAAHRLRGGAANVGLTDLTDLWTTIEEGLRGGEAAALDALPLERALAETDRAVSILAGPVAPAA